VRAAVDVMGGDHAPAAILKGCWEAASFLDPSQDGILLVGDQEVSRAGLEASGLPADKKALYKIVHTTEVVAMDDSPSRPSGASPIPPSA